MDIETDGWLDGGGEGCNAWLLYSDRQVSDS